MKIIRNGKLLMKLVLFFIAISMIQSFRFEKEKVDLIVYGATIYTMDSLNSICKALAIKDGKIIATGRNKDIMGAYFSDKKIDASGLFVYPGFIDAHSHFTGYAQYLRYIDLSKSESFESVVKILVQFHNQHPSAWIIGRGWDQNKWTSKQFPDNSILDKLFPDIPVVLTRVDGHAVIANSAALRIAGISEPFPVGEEIVMDGKSTGVFLENTAEKIRQAIPLPSFPEMKELIIRAAFLCQSVGLTGVNDAGIDKAMILLLDSLQRSGELKLRIDANINPTEENMNYFMHGRDFSTDRLRVGAVKIYSDGALGSRGACLLRPYSDDSGNYGILVTSENEIRNICKQAYQNGFQVNTHAIGDSAVRLVLSIYSEILKGKNDRRWRIEHAQVVNKSDFELFGKFSVIPSVQTTHATSDMAWAKSRLGEERLKYAYAYHDLLVQNGWIANGTDFPVEDISPLKTFYAAVFRKDGNGNPSGGFQVENALSRLKALRSITSWAAKAAFQEKVRGSLQNGKFADLVITDTDLLKAPESSVLKTTIQLTMINGEVVYSNNNQLFK